MADIAETAAWYEERQRGLGERFTREVVAALDALLLHPLIHRLRNRRLGARWCFPRSFRTDERRQLGPQQRQLVGHEPSPYDLAFGRSLSPRRATLALRA